MKKKLYFDPIGGIAGDMFSAAFIDAGLIDIQTLQKTMALFDSTITLIYEQSQQSHIIGGRLRVVTAQGEEDHAAMQEHHEHYSFKLIRQRLLASALPQPVSRLALTIFTTLARAEAKLHNVLSLDDLSFHEVGRDDAIADIICAAACLCALPEDVEICCGPIPVGQGDICFSHGRFSLPAPATAEILQGIPIHAGKGQYEMTTPTGAAIIVNVCHQFIPTIPAIAIKAIGYGHGHMQPPDFPNSLRLFYGETAKQHENNALDFDDVLELTCNIDDQPGNLLAPCVERLLRAGAIDVFYSTYQGKKGRMGQQWVVLVKPEQESFFAQMMLQELGTIGLRVNRCHRYKLKRELMVYTIDDDYCQAKKIFWGDQSRVYPETDEVIRFAEKWDLSLSQTWEKLNSLIQKEELCQN